MIYMHHSFFNHLLSLSICILGLLLSSCCTTRTHHLLGEDATIKPGIDRISGSAKEAFLAPKTWVPLAAAVLIAATNNDSKIQEWAKENKPIFGSTNNAIEFSNHFVRTTTLIYIGSLVIAPGGNQLPAWLLNKAKGFTVGASAIFTTQLLTSELKTISGRERPDKSEKRSFPSGHTAAVSVNTILTSRNIEHLDLNPFIEGSLDIAFTTMTLATGWARIEGARHYPTDILIGAALGNFVGAFINDAFLGRYKKNIIFSTTLCQTVSSINLCIRF
jgi:membrane-associated phospholipid phosphatase